MIRNAVNILIIALIAVIGLIVYRSAGPSIEMAVSPPINNFTLEEVECQDGMVRALFLLDKAEYGENQSAQFLGLSIYTTETPRVRLPWTNVENDRSPASRPPGVQLVDIMIMGPCGSEVIAYTKHQSPITGLILHSRFGPFTLSD